MAEAETIEIDDFGQAIRSEADEEISLAEILLFPLKKCRKVE